ncbi:lipid-A-disaccharide synthase [Flavitalea sp. BT771]|uniref:lipid-A-disaccharide synthase n=1 Tax=Flavitalea sp. BT771 TaxID=3063329 RepID=UPI0026E47679|nr:lipid-A-disaccharide synthase [Flavitalea sp. BT771]MDO6431975.1 lipid-A-disaccharide synthase [Flavitalea sp. BT771]MDV6220884.1 lipid-A-disaccharide synthase [Flavitalea sp. BT771]
MKYYIIAGEASGDLHGSNLIKELRKADPRTEVRCWGGDLMAAAGGVLVKHYKDLAFMGFVEVLSNLRTIFRNLEFCRQDIQAYQPDALILVDYPGFNMRIAKWAHRQGIKVIYYISPQVWAWKEGRVRQIKEHVDKMLVILPFEKEFYRRWNFEVEYVGHPLVEVIDRFLADDRLHTMHTLTPTNPLAAQSPQLSTHSSPLVANSLQLAALPIIALLPGSRRQEILKKLPLMLEVCRHFPNHLFIVAKAPGLEDAFYEDMLKAYPNVSSVRNETYALLSKASAACVTSGTATLETALFGVPEIVCYKGSPVSYQIARRLIKVKYISLVNLIMDKLVVKELIQDQLTPDNLRKELDVLLNDPQKQRQLRADYKALKELLSQGGHASANAAHSILQFLNAS